MREHDLVKLKETYNDIPAGMSGTVIHLYQEEEVVEVEFVCPGFNGHPRIETTPVKLLQVIRKK